MAKNMGRNKITTLKLRQETKQRLERLKEHKKETYDELLRKILYILNTTRIEPTKSQGILKNIDLNRSRNMAKNKENSDI